MNFNNHLRLLSSSESIALDKIALPIIEKRKQAMEQAAAAVVAVIKDYYEKKPILCLAGPGFNGGDAIITATMLHHAGWPVTLCLNAGAEERPVLCQELLKQYPGARVSADELVPSHYQILVDGLYGTGSRNGFSDSDKNLLKNFHNWHGAVVAIDIPTGVDASNGMVNEPDIAIQAAHTVTFVRPKTGCFLYPGRQYCGMLHLADIGISDEFYPHVQSSSWLNEPILWHDLLPMPDYNTHKYSRGALWAGAGIMAGASRLLAMAALRIGAGAVFLGTENHLRSAYAATEAELIISDIDGWDKKNYGAYAIGSGFGEVKSGLVYNLLQTKKPIVIDADALETAIDLHKTAGAFHSNIVLTPHAGEFKRTFPNFAHLPRIDAARMAAANVGAIIVLKGADTVIAHPDGKVLINHNASAWLATAGSGDVLAGFIAGLLAQQMPVFAAAAAAVWMHGELGKFLGQGLIASDLCGALPVLLKKLYSETGLFTHQCSS